MDYITKGEDLSKIKAGFVSAVTISISSCGGNDVYCSSDSGCAKKSQCVHPTVYAGCSGGILTFSNDTSFSPIDPSDISTMGPADGDATISVFEV